MAACAAADCANLDGLTGAEGDAATRAEASTADSRANSKADRGAPNEDAGAGDASPKREAGGKDDGAGDAGSKREAGKPDTGPVCTMVNLVQNADFSFGDTTGWNGYEAQIAVVEDPDAQVPSGPYVAEVSAVNGTTGNYSLTSIQQFPAGSVGTFFVASAYVASVGDAGAGQAVVLAIRQFGAGGELQSSAGYCGEPLAVGPKFQQVTTTCEVVDGGTYMDLIATQVAGPGTSAFYITDISMAHACPP
jgi:hypothetical protein